LLAHGWWFYLGTSASSTTKTGRHNIAESGVNTPKIQTKITKLVNHSIILMII
jgi:hypothetical protein